jgi:hypothetical protein
MPEIVIDAKLFRTHIHHGPSFYSACAGHAYVKTKLAHAHEMTANKQLME